MGFWVFSAMWFTSLSFSEGPSSEQRPPSKGSLPPVLENRQHAWTRYNNSYFSTQYQKGRRKKKKTSILHASSPWQVPPLLVYFIQPLGSAFNWRNDLCCWALGYHVLFAFVSRQFLALNLFWIVNLLLCQYIHTNRWLRRGCWWPNIYRCIGYPKPEVRAGEIKVQKRFVGGLEKIIKQYTKE